MADHLVIIIIIVFCIGGKGGAEMVERRKEVANLMLNIHVIRH